MDSRYDFSSAVRERGFPRSTRGLRSKTRRAEILPLLISFLLSITFLGGCSSKIIKLVPLSDRPHAPVKESQATRQTLRQYSLREGEPSPIETLVRLQRVIDRQPTPELLLSFAELSYREGLRQERKNPALAAEIFIASALHSYRWLFDPAFEAGRNPYSEQFRLAALHYNQSVERLLRLMELHRTESMPALAPGEEIVLNSEDRRWTMRCVRANDGVRSWQGEEIDHFRFVSDFKLIGLQNRFAADGVGVPVVAVRKKGNFRPEEEYYPPELSFPMTLFLRPNPKGASPHIAGSERREPEAILEFHDPLKHPTVTVGKIDAPLAYDLSAALAHNFLDPTSYLIGTVGLTRPEEFAKPIPGEGENGRKLEGLYLMQPYSPDKIPVVMIHGLWSSPMTWIEMVNSLLAVPEIRENCQFWFYFYPSGIPWWVSAAELRQAMSDIRQTLDPNGRSARFDETVLIGHSMGGLIARLQVAESGEDVWRLVSDRPLPEFPEERQSQLRSCFFFEPNRSIRRVVTIATPFKGSDSANSFTRWLADKAITPPKLIDLTASLAETVELKTDKKSDADQRAESLLAIQNSIDSLAPDSPFFSVLEQLRTPPNVAFNNIVGVSETEPFSDAPKGDGIVDYKSAHLEGIESELEVRASHMTVHTNPAAIQETVRILLEHIYQMNVERTAQTRNKALLIK